MRSLTLGALTALLVSAALPAAALNNDPTLSKLCVASGGDPALPCGASPKADQAAFAALSKEYGVALAPKLLAPAETLGANGFQFSLQLSTTTTNSDEAYWKEAVNDPPSALMTTQIDVRKGLPFSFEMGATATYLIESELWAFGGSLKWALNEAINDFPVDFAIRGSLNRMVGSSEMQLSTAGMDLILSRSFGAGGVANIGPYMAYSPAWIFARSGVLDSTPGNGDDPSGDFVFSGEDQTVHRFVLGSRFVFSAVNFTPEVALAKGVQSYNINFGLDF
ncbi:hypothetical protein KKB55_05025 [Myxococcota bacterium]|nr:hypothetical protein [Myxococcota bacterium]MBU1897116.1 hypothetical protein [Myxococcota bacterium]